MESTAQQFFVRKSSQDYNPFETINQNFTLGHVETSKQSAKDIKMKVADKTQRIKKEKKIDKKPASRDGHFSKAEISAFEGDLVRSAIIRLQSHQSIEGSKQLLASKRLTRQRLLQFLELIEEEYSRTVKIYLESSINKQSCGNLRVLLIRFIDHTIETFPVLNNIVYQYAFQYYKAGPLRQRFDRLMDKNITPILNLMSKEFVQQKRSDKTKEKMEEQQSETTQVSKSPERECLDDFESEEDRKAEKKKRKRNKRKEKELIFEEKEEDIVTEKIQAIAEHEEIDRKMLQLTNFLQNMTMEDTPRQQYRIDENILEAWDKRIKQLILAPQSSH